MISFTVLGTQVEYREGVWVSTNDVGRLVTGFNKLYVAMPHDYSPSPVADFIQWLGKYFPVEDVHVPETTAQGSEVY